MCPIPGYTNDISSRHHSFNGPGARHQPYDIDAPWGDERRLVGAPRSTGPTSHHRADPHNSETGYSRDGRYRANGAAGQSRKNGTPGRADVQRRTYWPFCYATVFSVKDSAVSALRHVY